MSDKLVHADEPRDDEKAGERPESEPLQEVDHLLGKVFDDLRWERQGDDHDWQEDGTADVSIDRVRTV